MFRRTFTGSLVAASLAAGALMTMPAASAAPTWVGADSVSGETFLPASADVAVAEDGDAVATWLAGGRVMASSASHGVWGPAKFVSDPGETVSSPAAAVNDHGDAVVTWGQLDNTDHNRLAVSRRKADLSWDGRSYIDPPVDKSVSGRPDIDLDPQGTLRAAYVATDGGTFNQVRLSTQVKGSQTSSTKFVSDAASFAPALAVNASGAVLVSWFDAEVGESRIMSRRQLTPAGTWEAAKEVAPFGSYLAETDAALSDSGFGTVAYIRNWEGDARVEAVKVQPDGFIGNGSFVSPAGTDAHAIHLDQNASGTALLSWVAAGGTNEIGYATRKQTSGWDDHLIDAPVANPQEPRSAIADNGTRVIGYVGNGHLLGSFWTSPINGWQHSDSGNLGIKSASTLLGMDGQGNTFLGAVRDLGGGLGEVRGAFLDVAGPTSSITAPTVAHSLNPKFTVGRTASDRLSNVTTGSIRMRSAAWNGGFGSYSYPQVNQATKTISFTGAPGNTYCFSAQAKDSANNLGSWSAERCTTVPVDDRTMKRVKGFKKATGSSHYLGTFVKAKKKGSKLILDNVRAKQIAIVAAKAAKGGKIKVIFGGQTLGTYSLKGAGTKQLVAVKNLGSLKTGKLVIKVVSKTGKLVKIDGIVAAK